MHLSLELNKNISNLQDLLKFSFEPEKVDDYICENCKIRGQCVNSYLPIKMPIFLIISLKRFGILSSKSQNSSIQINSSKLSQNVYIPRILSFMGRSFKLLTSLNHYGNNLNSGHFQALVFNHTYCTVSSDEQRKDIDFSVAQAHINSNGYVFFFL
jgi:ubiquitin C-terminal hydrolase